jgi:hypothetical protein
MRGGRWLDARSVVLGGAVAAVVALLRAHYLRWGATAEEVNLALPGDELVPHADLTATRAVTVGAAVDGVWPWIAQLGQGRGGFYSYDFIENLVGCDIRSADRIVLEWPSIDVGDAVNLHPDVGLIVAVVEPGRALVLRGGVPVGRTPPPYDFTWAFVLRDQTDGTTRLVVRERYGYVRRWAPLLVEPTELISFVMSQRMLRGIKERAERASPLCPNFGGSELVATIRRRRLPPMNEFRNIAIAWLVGLMALAFSALYLLSDVIEAIQDLGRGGGDPRLVDGLLRGATAADRTAGPAQCSRLRLQLCLLHRHRGLTANVLVAGRCATRTVSSEASSPKVPLVVAWRAGFGSFVTRSADGPGGMIPDVDEAVDSPRRLTDDPDRAQRALDLVPWVPTPVWGRDELGIGEGWNSNSMISWLVARSGLDTESIQPPIRGRAPGSQAGLVVARRQCDEAARLPGAQAHQVATGVRPAALTSCGEVDAGVAGFVGPRLTEGGGEAGRFAGCQAAEHLAPSRDPACVWSIGGASGARSDPA